MATPAALISDDILLSEDDLRRGWNQQADKYNQWESLDSAEQLAWAQASAIAADRARWKHPNAAAPAPGENLANGNRSASGAPSTFTPDSQC